MTRPHAPFRRAPLLALLLALALLDAGGAAAEESCRPTSDGAALRLADGRLPNVLLVTVDTLRADHVAYQGEGFTGLTPGLDQLAASSTVFLHATTPAPATRPAMASLMTGSFVGRHGVASNQAVLMPGVPLLATIFKANGYATAAFYGNSILSRRAGFARGFDVFRDFSREGWSPDPKGVRHASDWLASAPSEPWLLWVHLMSPHGPYNSAPRPSLMVLENDDPLPDVELEPIQSNYGLGPIIPKYQLLRARRASEYRRRYREEVFFADAQIAQLLADLDARGLADTTLVVVTADHGESLGEHDYYLQHGWLANEPSLHVPLLVRLPCRVAAGARVHEPVSLVDVLPTLVAGLGLDAPAAFAGRSLVPALAGEPIGEAPAFSLSAYLNQVTALRRGSWKLVHTPLPPRPLPHDWWHDYYAKAEAFALYDLAADPGETTDLSAREAERFATMRAELGRWENENGVAQRARRMPAVDRRQREQLRALGYVD